MAQLGNFINRRKTTNTRNARGQHIFWGCGYSFLVAQWLSNGSFGSSWLPGYTALGNIALVGQVLIYVVYFILLPLVGFKGAKLLYPLNSRLWFYTCGTACIIVGNLFSFLAGSGYILPALYLVGMVLIGVGMTILMIGWGTYYCSVGPRATCAILALCFIAGSGMFAMLGVISEISLLLAIAIQLGLLPFSQVMLVMGWRSSQSGELVEKERKPSSLKPLLPYFAVVSSLGLFLGVIIGLNSAQDSASSPFVWTAGMSVMGALILAGVLLTKDFSLDNLSRTLTPLLVVCALLIPALMHNSFEVACLLGCAAYVFARIFYQVAYVSIAQTGKVPIIPLVACAIAADSLGIITGQILCKLAAALNILNTQSIYVIVLITVSLVILMSSFFLRDKNVISLWGFKSTDFSDDTIELRCMQIAAQSGLTLRETEILVSLSKGLVVEDISKDLSITITTTRTHMRNIYQKLEVHSQPELIRKVLFDKQG